jgi:hypothetical protein
MKVLHVTENAAAGRGRKWKQGYDASSLTSRYAPAVRCGRRYAHE